MILKHTLAKNGIKIINQFNFSFFLKDTFYSIHQLYSFTRNFVVMLFFFKVCFHTFYVLVF